MECIFWTPQNWTLLKVLLFVVFERDSQLPHSPLADHYVFLCNKTLFTYSLAVALASIVVNISKDNDNIEHESMVDPGFPF